ncbi:4-alpha-glucanotransferase [Glaciimonas immobilis]|uniref:4-alpha-glucanotransferase n=1 Tax=Glaciimonas immobilis TaxID=728004 RepID=A0A840RPA4_9BURK|nr:4-alpha-glucanotransferase [Glaciimonas immobilis]KAF3997824.1 4-alpha-glucanotransferase [Glaciimonas immobilis]MBB5199545.1 4-alpha-glucanotransferase [Glaciimonas immobilis]
MTPKDLILLAEQAGLMTGWADAHGAPHDVAPTVLMSLLEAVGLPCRSNAEYLDSKARLNAQQTPAGLPPLLTAQIGQPIRLPFQSQSSGATAGSRLHGHGYEIALENGGTLQGCFPTDTALPLYISPIHISGYHRLLVGGESSILAVAPTRCYGVSDARAGNTNPAKPANDPAYLWGLAVQLYSLRRHGDGGLGDFTALKMLACDAAQQGAAALAISPVHAMFSADPGRYSPYGPSSRLFLNAFHIDPAAAASHYPDGPAIETDFSYRGQELPDLENPSAVLTAASGAQPEGGPLIDWSAAGTARLALLRAAYSRFLQGGPSGPSSAFETFCRDGGTGLQDHARYEALQEWLAFQIGGDNKNFCDWRLWPADYRNPRSSAVTEFAQQYSQQIGFHLFLQWHAALGLAGAQLAARDAGMPIGLIADLAIGAERGGSQSWSEQSEMLNGLSIGAPPDLLNVVGQNWGLGAYSPWGLQASGFRSFIAMLRACFVHAGGARIDHVLGLARLWLIPEGASARDGAYLRYPLEDMLRLIALESWRHRAIVIGENLGTVPPGFNARLADINLLGIDVLWFQRDGMRFVTPKAWSATSIATTTTHDLPTVAGWWTGTDIGWRARLDLLGGNAEADETILRAQERRELWQTATENGCATGSMPPSTLEGAPIEAALRLVGSAPAPLALIPLEDMLGLAEQPNLPGTVEPVMEVVREVANEVVNERLVAASHPNWRRRLPVDVAHLLQGPAVQTYLNALKRARAAVTHDAALNPPSAAFSGDGNKESS